MAIKEQQEIEARWIVYKSLISFKNYISVADTLFKKIQFIIQLQRKCRHKLQYFKKIEGATRYELLSQMWDEIVITVHKRSKKKGES